MRHYFKKLTAASDVLKKIFCLHSNWCFEKKKFIMKELNNVKYFRTSNKALFKWKKLLRLVPWNNWVSLITVLSRFSRINHRPFVVLDDWSKCCEIKPSHLAYGLLQVLSWNNDSIIEKKGWQQLIFQYIHAWNQRRITVRNYDISLLQLMFCKNTVDLKERMAATCFYNRKRAIHRMDGCHWNGELTQYLVGKI